MGDDLASTSTRRRAPVGTAKSTSTPVLSRRKQSSRRRPTYFGLLPIACEVFPLGLDQREVFTLRTHRGAIDRGSLRRRSRSGSGITVTLSATG